MMGPNPGGRLASRRAQAGSAFMAALAFVVTCALVAAVAAPAAMATVAVPQVSVTISDQASLTDANRVRVTTIDGVVEGIEDEDGLNLFRGIPYAAPPVRELRWREPQPVAPWEGVRPADRFADRCMQRRIFDDMRFRNSGTSEDCLYLNVWTPEASTDARLPVLVYFYGGGFIAGDGSEPRYDGASMAREGIVVVTMSYRLGIFGFFAHPELTAESPHGASGNYALLDQTAALQWVRKNIGAFGGDPDRVTIAGESAGSFSVSAQMASPRSKSLIAGAIGESGSLLGTFRPAPLEEAEAAGKAFGERIGASTLADLRALSAMELLAESSKPGAPRFATVIDGYFFPHSPLEIFVAGDQAAVPLLLGWNSEEMTYQAVLGPNEPTPENYEAAVRNLYGDRAGEVLEVYPSSDARQSATDLAGDRFIGYSTWKWFDLHRRTADAPVYRYYYAHARPPMRPEAAPQGMPPEGSSNEDDAPRGAVHSAEIEYALGNLDVNDIYQWNDEDYVVSRAMKTYFANFIKSGDPNDPDLPEWPAAAADGDAGLMMMRLEEEPRAVPAPHRERYLLLDRLAAESAEN